MIMSKVIIPKLQVERIISALKENKRLDGRSPLEYRDIKVERNLSNSAESSVSVKIGKTEVYCGVKMAVTTPYSDSPNAGTFMMTAEMHPMASNNFDMGRPGINAIELARVIDRGIRESGFIDFEGLCIKEGEKVWQVFVDVIIVNDDGNLFDATGLAALIALGSAKLPVYDKEEDKLEHELSNIPLPLNKELMSFNMTLYKVGDKIIVDPSREEEEISDYRLSVAFGDNDGEARITALQKGRAGVINTEDMKNILKVVEDKFATMFPKVKTFVWDE